MANLTQKTVLLLDKLYNLRGPDNILLQELASKIEGVTNAIQENEQRKLDLEREREDSKNNLLLFSSQEEAFRTAFTGVDDSTFSALKNIGIDLNIGSMMAAVTEKAPLYITSQNERIARLQEELDRNLAIRGDLENQLSDLQRQQSQGENDRHSLDSLLEQSLSSDETERESLPTKYVKDILARFGVFEPSEVNVLTKLIMFPEDGLEEYDSTYEDRLKRGLVGEVEEVVYEEPVKEEIVEKPIVFASEQHEEEPQRQAEQPLPHPEGQMVMERAISLDDTEEPKEIVPPEDTSIMDLTSLNGENQKEIPKQSESITDYLEAIGLDMNRFYEENDKENNVNKLMSELANTDKKLISNNYELLRSVDAEVAAYRYRHNHSYLSDPELSQKLTLLRTKGISEKNIRELLERANSGLRENLETVEGRFKAAEVLGTPIDNEHIDILSRDLNRLGDNIRLLRENEIDIDEKEQRNYQYILTESPYIRPDLEILKDYLINITRSNDKYALNVFAKDPYDLITDIDNIIENNLEDVLSTNPEVLTGRNGAFVDRVRYYEKQGKPIIDTTGKNAYAPYILSPLEALKENGGKSIPVSPSEEEINPKLPSIIGNQNTVMDLTNALAVYYSERTDFTEVEIPDDCLEPYGRLLEMFEQGYHAERIGKYTFRVADNYISKPKLERHIRVILKALYEKGASVDGIENEVLLTAMLYNLRQDTRSLSKMVETCLGFNEDNTLGGRTL